MGASSVQDFESLMQSNLTEDNDVTTEDADLAEKVHSFNARDLEAKSRR